MSCEEKDIELFSKILNTNAPDENSPFQKEHDEFYKALGEFRQQVYELSLIETKELCNTIFAVAESMEIYSIFPNLIGKTIIGISGWYEKVIQALKFIAGEDSTLNKNIPTVLIPHDGCTEIFAINDVQKRILLKKKDIKDLSRLLSTYQDIDINKIVNVFALMAKSRFNNTAVVFFPPYFSESNSFFRAILNKLQYSIIYPYEPNADKGGITKRFIGMCKNNSIPLYAVNDSENSLGIQEVKELGKDNISILLNMFNRYCSNADLYTEIKYIILKKVKFFYEKHISLLEKDLKRLREDLVRTEDENIEDKLQKMRSDTENSLRKSKEEYDKIRISADNLLCKAKEYTAAMHSYAGIKNTTETHTQRDLRLIGEISILESLLSPLAAEESLKILESSGYKQAYIYRLICNYNMGMEISRVMLNQLKGEPGTEIVSKAKILLRKELGLGEEECKQAASYIESPDTAMEFIYKAGFLLNAGELKSAADNYVKALDIDAETVGYEVYKTLKKEPKLKDYNITMLTIANYMVPIACYDAGRQKLKENRYSKNGKILIRLAAAKEYIPAIKFLADELFSSIKSIIYQPPNNDLSEQDKTNLEKCKNLYKFILEKGSETIDISKICENIGDIYHRLKDDYDAKKYWEHSDTPSSYYKLGRLYQYVTDATFAQDLDKAIEYFEKAIQKGYDKASKKLQQVKEWKEKNSNKPVKITTYSPKIEIQQGKKESCFITTATCKALNKPDDCEELMSMRSFRDNLKQKSSEISILIKEYYRIAPHITDKIDEEPNAKQIYMSIWSNYISVSYSFIKQGKYSEAAQIYIKMTLLLANRYAISLSPDVLEIIQRQY